MTMEITRGSVFDAIETDAAAAELLKIKAALMDCIRGYIAGHGSTRRQAADLMGVQRSRTGDVSLGWDRRSASTEHGIYRRLRPTLPPVSRIELI